MKLKSHLTKGKGQIKRQSYFQSIAYVYLFDILQNGKMYTWSMKLLLEWRKKKKEGKIKKTERKSRKKREGRKKKEIS